jgi:thymidylate synthase (FAD)
MKPEIKLIAITQGAGELVNKNAQEVISYIARVSNPNNQLNFDTAAGLLRYCIKHEHWSIFEQAYMTLEINTTRGIAAQVLRHRSFTFQEFSQRYADTNLLSDTPVIPDLRRQDTKNRQNSIDDISDYVKLRMQGEISEYFAAGQRLYNGLLEQGVAKECARFVLPLATPTRIYMTGSCRSWIHYINLRSAHGTQKEHMDIALECKKIFAEQFPSVAEALEWI